MTYIDWTMNNYFAKREIRTFDVDAFINDVYNRFCGTPNEESREDLQELWNKVLAMPRGGDASLYPNAHGPRPALLEVWHKAGDFWRANGFSKPARLLCDQNGIVIDEETAQKIATAKAAISGTDSTTATESTEATETPQDAQADASEAIIQPASDTPAEAMETPTATAADPFSVCDGSTVAPQATASDLASEPASDTEDAAILSDTDDYDPGVIVPEAAYPSPTPRRRRTRRTRTAAASLPSLFDGCEITDSADAPVETPANNEATPASGIVATLKGITSNKTAREIAKGVGILAALAIIWQTGLLIPFALIGGIAAGVVK